MLRPLAFCLLALAVTACAPEMSGGEPAPASSSAPTPDVKPVIVAGVDLSGPIKFTGTEPFWSLTVSENDIVLERPDAAPRHFTPGQFHMDGQSAELRSGELSATVQPKPCSDGMSDRAYPLTAEVRVGDTVYKGCAISSADGAKDKP